MGREGGRRGVLQLNSCSWRQKRKLCSTTQDSCWRSDHLSFHLLLQYHGWLCSLSLIHTLYVLLLEEQEREHLVAEVQQRVDRLKKEQKKRDALTAKIKVS